MSENTNSQSIHDSQSLFDKYHKKIQLLVEKNNRMQPIDRLVIKDLVRLGKNRNGFIESFGLTHKDIASLQGSSTKTIERSTDRLEKLGYLAKKQSKYKSKKHQGKTLNGSHRYFINLPTLLLESIISWPSVKIANGESFMIDIEEGERTLAEKLLSEGVYRSGWEQFLSSKQYDKEEAEKQRKKHGRPKKKVDQNDSKLSTEVIPTNPQFDDETDNVSVASALTDNVSVGDCKVEQTNSLYENYLELDNNKNIITSRTDEVPPTEAPRPFSPTGLNKNILNLLKEWQGSSPNKINSTDFQNFAIKKLMSNGMDQFDALAKVGGKYRKSIAIEIEKIKQEREHGQDYLRRFIPENTSGS